MSCWLYVTNLPNYFDEYGLIDLFKDVGKIRSVCIQKDNLLLKSQGFVKFDNEKYTKLGASKKDGKVIGNNAIRVYIVWNSKDTLTTVKISNLESTISTKELQDLFTPYGDIVDIRINNKNNSIYAYISFTKVEYALQASQEMNGQIIFGYNETLKVSLLNPDARNLKWKRNTFQYISVKLPNKNNIKNMDNYNNDSLLQFPNINNDKNSIHNKSRKYNRKSSKYSRNNKQRNNRYHSNSLMGPLQYYDNAGYSTYNIQHQTSSNNTNTSSSNGAPSVKSFQSNTSSIKSQHSSNNKLYNNNSNHNYNINHNNNNTNTPTYSNNAGSSPINSNTPINISPITPNNNYNASPFSYATPYYTIQTTPTNGNNNKHYSKRPTKLSPQNASPNVLTIPAFNAKLPNGSTTPVLIVTPPSYQASNNNLQAIQLTPQMMKYFSYTSPINASPINASPINASPINASPINASPLGTSPITPNYHPMFNMFTNNNPVSTPKSTHNQYNTNINQINNSNNNLNNISNVNVTSQTETKIIDDSSPSTQHRRKSTPTEIPQSITNEINDQQLNIDNNNNSSKISKKKKKKKKKNKHRRSDSNSSTNSSRSSKSNKSNKSRKKKKKKSFWTTEQQKLGDILYDLLKDHYPRKVGKIVGMLLRENTVNDINYLVSNTDLLAQKIQQYVQILYMHDKNRIKNSKNNIQ